MTAMLIAQVCSFSAQLERQAIARCTWAAWRARALAPRPGRPLRIDEDQMTAIHQDLADDMMVVVITRKYGISRTKTIAKSGSLTAEVVDGLCWAGASCPASPRYHQEPHIQLGPNRAMQVGGGEGVGMRQTGEQRDIGELHENHCADTSGSCRPAGDYLLRRRAG